MEGSGTPKDGDLAVDSVTDSSRLLESLQQRADNLLTEFRSYQAYLKSKNLSKTVETRIFRRGVEAEHKNLVSLRPPGQKQDTDNVNAFETKDEESKRLQALRSSNLPFYEAVWASGRRCRGIRAFGRRLYWDDVEQHTSQKHNLDRPVSQKKTRSALVDIVAEDGAEWIKVSIVNAKRLLFEMAKEGWEGYGNDESDDETMDGDSRNTTSSSTSKLEIVRLAEDLRDASHATRVKYQHPRVKFILPRILQGEDEMIDAVLADIRATGANVVCSESTTLDLDCQTDNKRVSQASLFDAMLPSPSHPQLTPTLNIDCTILLALISDISHKTRSSLPPPPSNTSGTYHTAIVKQIKSEEHTPLLPSELYQVLEGRKLVCTELAAKRMREIVATMGTEGERERGEVLFGQGKHAGRSTTELREAWTRLSSHAVPETLNLPIKVEDFVFDAQQDEQKELQTVNGPHTKKHNDGLKASPALPSSIAHQLANSMNLSPINASVFIYGWTLDIVTVTSNKVVAVGIERTLNQTLDEDEGSCGVDAGTDFVGPKIYICETARSLIGKEKVNGLRP